MNINMTARGTWSENVIIVDADFVDRVAFDLIVNFERMIGRRIPPADMARWIDCIALDGGVREGAHDTSVVLIHDRQTTALANFQPSSLTEGLNGKAFRDNLGEFAIAAYPVENLVSKSDFLTETVQIACSQKEVRRIMVVSDDGETYDKVRLMLAKVDDDDKRITLFAMQPMQGGNFRQEILGYSLMSALGIRGSEIKE